MSRFNWSPVDPVFLDFETQSPVNLREAGSTAYLSHPSTRVLSLVAIVDGMIVVWVPPGRGPAGLDRLDPRPTGEGRPVEWWFGEGPPPRLLRAIVNGRTCVAHNAEGFDAVAWEKLIGDPCPVWYDTIHCCRAAGLPAGLDAASAALGGPGKDEAGGKAAKLLYTVKQGRFTVGTPALWQAALRYNIVDVVELERVYRASLDFGEPDVLGVHCTINARGIAVDRRYLETLTGLWHDLQRDSAAGVEALTDGALAAADLRSGPKVHRWLQSKGLHLDTLNRKELERFYDEPGEWLDDLGDADLIIEVLKLRQIATRSSTGKLARIAGSMEDGRVRRLLKYWGAHTGRWSGAGIQPQNLSKGAAGLDVEKLLGAFDRGELTAELVRVAALAAGVSVDDALSALLRPTFVAEPGHVLAILDYAAIEARGIAWIAGQEDLLAIFREGRDPYLDMASAVFGRACTKADKVERQIGKTIVLGCGYGMSSTRFGGYCKLNRIDLAAAGTDAEACIETYRGKNARIVQVWRDIDRTVRGVVERGHEDRVARCRVRMDGSVLVIELPSGRPLRYRSARIVKQVPGWARLRGLDTGPRPCVVFDDARHGAKEIYGGLLAENIVQAICRDLLATALVRAEAAGIDVVLHVHDEIVAEVPADRAAADLHRLGVMMETTPLWAEGFPVAVEGFTASRYVKAPLSDSEKF